MWKYLDNVHKHLEVGEKLPNISIENNKLGLLESELPLWVGGGNHGTLSGSKKSITCKFHV